ncbi:plasmid maintenance system killer protein [bacterium BMS3Abin07]|nr:plasmid maintenance system killer protein [bacterium BMS3Abin07]HDZ87331.1 killer suppression protein [Nitrospirota bacterium]
MVILFKRTKIEKECNNKNIMAKKYGPKRANLLKRRLSQLAAADVLDDLYNLPQARCHELKGELKGYLSVDLDHPYRLIFEPANNPIPKKSDGGLDWTKINEIRIISVEDTHG